MTCIFFTAARCFLQQSGEGSGHAGGGRSRLHPTADTTDEGVCVRPGRTLPAPGVCRRDRAGICHNCTPIGS